MNEEDYAELVRRRPDLAMRYQRVEGSTRQSSYYRRIPRIYRDVHARPPTLVKAQLNLAKAAYSLYHKNLHGFEDEMPIIAFKLREILKGKKVKLPAWKEAILKESEI